MKYLASIIAAVTALVGIFAPQLQQLVSSHPTVALVLGSLYAILAHFLPSPTQQAKQ